MCEKHNNEGNCFTHVDSGLKAVQLNCTVNGENSMCLY